MLDDIGNPKVPDEFKSDEHHALADAKWNKKVYEWVQLMGNIKPVTLPLMPNTGNTGTYKPFPQNLWE